MKGSKYHIRELTDKDAQCMIGGCPQIYEIVKTECMAGACPAIYNVTKEDCLVGGCPAIFEGLENKDVYLIVGKQMKPEEFEGLAGKVGVDETVIAVPKSLIDKLVDKLSERK